MKRILLFLSALLLCGGMTVGAGAAEIPLQTQLTRQSIAHFQQNPPEKDTETDDWAT